VKAATRLGVAVLAALTLGTPAASVARTSDDGPAVPPVVGISDNKPDMFSSPLFADLGVRHARLITPYDAALTEPERLDAWLDAARAAGVEPHVAFQHRRQDRCPELPCKLPSTAEFVTAFRAFRTQHPDVRSFTPWNEANHKTQPTHAHPTRAAAYYRAVRTRCGGCTVVAADVLGDRGMVSWVRRFRSTLKIDPVLWGLHNYADVNDGGTAATDALLTAVPGEIWLTETGGIVGFMERTGAVIRPFSERRARDATERLLRLMQEERPRVTRAYVYHWNLGEDFNRFDAGLVRQDGTARPAFGVLRDALRPDLPSLGRIPARGPSPAWRAFARPELPVAPRVTIGDVVERLRDGSLRLPVRCVSPGPCRGRLDVRIGRRVWTGKVSLASTRLGRIRATLPRRVRDRTLPGAGQLTATVRMGKTAISRSVWLAPASRPGG